MKMHNWRAADQAYRLGRIVSCIKGVSLVATVFIITGVTAAIGGGALTDGALPKCLYVSSYQRGYEWSDGVEEGVRKVLEGKCELRQFDMDTKRNKSVEYKRQAALQAKAIIDDWKPDVVITSDDNAAKYLIVPFFKNSDVKFVFSGVNWTVDEYGFPYDNVTGIVEVAPIAPMLREAMNVSGGARGLYLGADTLTESKNYSRIAKGAVKLHGSMDRKLVSTLAQWKAAFIAAQQAADFVVIGSSSGLVDWDAELMREFVVSHSKKISVTNHKWMMHVSALGYTKIPQEQGDWAAQAGLLILSGTPVSDIPIISNRKWDLWINNEVVTSTGAVLSRRITRKAKKLAPAKD